MHCSSRTDLGFVALNAFLNWLAWFTLCCMCSLWTASGREGEFWVKMFFAWELFDIKTCLHAMTSSLSSYMQHVPLNPDAVIIKRKAWLNRTANIHRTWQNQLPNTVMDYTAVYLVFNNFMLTSSADIKCTSPDNDPSLTVTAVTLITTMMFVLLDNPNANTANQLCPVGSDFVVLVCGVYLWSKKKKKRHSSNTSAAEWKSTWAKHPVSALPTIMSEYVSGRQNNAANRRQGDTDAVKSQNTTVINSTDHWCSVPYVVYMSFIFFLYSKCGAMWGGCKHLNP